MAQPDTLTDTQPVRKSIRRLRWFENSFRQQVSKTCDETGIDLAIDDRKLAATFINWLRAFESHKPQHETDRQPFVGFAAGLMLRALIEHAPLGVRSKPDDVDDTNPAYFWPEGYVYVAYCLNMRSAVLEQDFHEDRKVAPELDEIRTWWSFKENVANDPALGIAFLDLFAGEKPDWTKPGVFRSRDVGPTALRFYERKTLTD